jgi:hypothetical protein
MTRTAAETIWVHAGDCGGPVCFELAGGFCWQCGAGPLRPYADDPASRYVHQDEILPSAPAGSS